MKFLPTIIGLALFLFGCAQLARFQDKSAEETARVITQYCENTDQTFRDDMREDINEHAAPHSIEVTCG